MGGLGVRAVTAHIKQGRCLRFAWQGVFELGLRDGKLVAHTMHGVLVTRIHRRPVDMGHKGIDIGSCIGTKVYVVGVFVHVQCQDGHATCQCVGVVGRPMVDQGTVTWGKTEQHPARTASQGLAHGNKFVTPALGAAKTGAQGQVHGGHCRFAVATQAGKVQLVQQHGVGGDQLFAFQAVQGEAGHAGKRGLRQLGADGVQAFDGTAVVVLVVALQKFFRQARQTGGVERQGLRKI